MDSLKSFGLPVAAGVSVITACTYYCLSRSTTESSKRKPKKQQAKPQTQTMVLFFDGDENRCYSCPNHVIDTCPVEQCPLRHLRKIVKIVSGARYSVDACLYSLTHPDLENAFINHIKNGRKVRCVFGERRKQEEEEFVKRLRSEGAFVTIKDGRYPPATNPKFQIPNILMHHKFVIVDNRILITGSMNWTRSSFYSNWDHMIITTDKYLVNQFVEEFECLFSGKAGEEKTYITRPTAGHPLQACFFRKQSLLCRPDANMKKKCDREDCMFTVYRSILHKIVSASTSVDICVQQLTLEDVGNELVLCHDNGIKIRVITDRVFARGTGSQIGYFMKEGIPVHMKSDTDTLHHKFIIIDGKTVLSGSLNWTMQSFFANYENLLLITDEYVVSEFQKEFERLWERFPPVNSVVSET